MPALNAWTLVVATMQTAAESFQADFDDALDQLAEDGSSRIVNVSRIARMQLMMVAVGGFSMLEGILEQRGAGDHPFQELDRRLREAGHDTIADEFMCFRLAINVLKHGSGPSYDRLRGLGDVPFRVKAPDETFFDEGDVSEVPALVFVDNNFVQRCALTIERAFTVLQVPQTDV